MGVWFAEGRGHTIGESVELGSREEARGLRLQVLIVEPRTVRRRGTASTLEWAGSVED